MTEPVCGNHFRAGVARAARKRMRGRDSRFQFPIPVAKYQPRRRSPRTATSSVMESTFCGFLIPEESDCMPSILELHAAWEAMFVDDVNIGDTAGRSTQPEKSMADTRKRFHAAMVSASFEDLAESFPRYCPRNSLYVCWISRTPRHSVMRKMFAIYASEAKVVPGRTSWLVVELRPCVVRVAHRFHVQDLLRRFHTHFPAVPRSTSVRVLS
jgi:hypothetical protein